MIFSGIKLKTLGWFDTPKTEWNLKAYLLILEIKKLISNNK